MSHAKLIWISWLAIASITLISYTSVQAYTYFTTTTIEDVRKQNDAFEKAKSELLKARVEYCNDTSTGKIDYDSCGEFLNKSLNTGTGKTPQVLPPSKSIKSPLEDLIEDNTLDVLHDKVCQKQINSPLCKDRKLFDRLYQLTEERLPWKNFYPILLWITNAESSLGLNFARDRVWWTCTWRNNFWGIKWKKTDDWKSVKDQQIPDQYGCYLYKFNSIEDYWISKVNTMRYGYKGCIDSKTPIRCLSWPYVGDRNIQEQSWINNVSIFL